MAVFKIKVSKGGKDATIDVESDRIQDAATYEEIFRLGLEAVVNSRMSKVGAITKLSGDELTSATAKAMEIATENVNHIYAGTLKSKKAKAKSDIPAAVKTRAMQKARERVRNQLREAGIKPISSIPASKITEAATMLLESDPTLLEAARAELEAEKAAASTAPVVDLSFIKSDPVVAKALAEHAAKAEATKAKRKATLSAKQAGIPAARKRKGSPETHPVH